MMYIVCGARRLVEVCGLIPASLSQPKRMFMPNSIASVEPEQPGGVGPACRSRHRTGCSCAVPIWFIGADQAFWTCSQGSKLDIGG